MVLLMLSIHCPKFARVFETTRIFFSPETRVKCLKKLIASLEFEEYWYRHTGPHFMLSSQLQHMEYSSLRRSTHMLSCSLAIASITSQQAQGGVGRHTVVHMKTLAEVGL